MLFFIEGAGTWELGTDRWYPWPQVNVPPLTLSQPLLLGIACNETSAGRASAESYWSGLPFASPGDLPNLGIEPGSLALQADSLLSEPPGKPYSLIL